MVWFRTDDGHKKIKREWIEKISCETAADHKSFRFYANIRGENLEICSITIPPTIFNKFLDPKNQFCDNQHITEEHWDNLWERYYDEGLEKIVANRGEELLQKLTDYITETKKNKNELTIELRDFFK